MDQRANVARICIRDTKKEPLPTPKTGIDRGSWFVFRAFKQVPKSTLISALKKKLHRECNLRSVNLRCSKACKPNSNSNALSILSLDDVALDYDGAIKTYTGSGTDLVIGMEGAALYASSPNALEVLLGEALAKTWANRYNKNTDIVLQAVERNINDQYDPEIGKLLDKGYLECDCRMT